MDKLNVYSLEGPDYPEANLLVRKNLDEKHGILFTAGPSNTHFHQEPNEDALCVCWVGDRWLFVAVDAHYGALACRVIINKARQWFTSRWSGFWQDFYTTSHEFLTDCLEGILSEKHDNPDQPDSSAAVLLTAVDQQNVEFASIGDCWLAIWNQQKGLIERNHAAKVWLGSADPEATWQELETVVEEDTQFGSFTLKEEDALIAMTDGLIDYFPGQWDGLASVLRGQQPVGEALNKAVMEILKNGEGENMAVVWCAPHKLSDAG